MTPAAGAPLVDADARERIRTSLDETIVVEAAAGTGKTTELINRLVNLLASGRTTVDRVVAVTFTEKAAGELKLRLRSGLEQARQHALDGATTPGGRAPDAEGREPAPQRLEHALAHLEEAHVSTIHGFCAELLRERPVEAGVDPRFDVLTERDARALYDEAFEDWLQAKLQNPDEGVRRALRRRARRGREDDPEETAADRLRKAGWDLAQWRDFPARWRRPALDRPRETLIDEVVRHVHEFAALTSRAANKHNDPLYVGTEPARRLSETIRAFEQVRPRDRHGRLAAQDTDWLEAALVELAGDYRFRKDVRAGRGTQFGDHVARADVVRAHADLVRILEEFKALMDADLAAELQGELLESIARYDELKTELGRLDFVDLLARARDLVCDRPDARADFQTRFTHIFVDEFQDTDPLQAEILLLLSADDPAVSDWRATRPVPGKLFIVGDPKQSIYRFRRADVAVYLEVRDLLARRGARVEHLTASFRAVPSLQRLINAAFAPVMTGDRDILQAEYVPLAPYRAEPTGHPTAIVLPVPKPYGKWRLAQTAIEASLPDAIGAFVEWLIAKSGWAIAARDICVLFRRFESWGQDVTRAYVAALEARGIPQLLVGGKSFHAREEVETVRAALAAIEWPDDELSVFATLHGSLFAVTDEDLFEYRERFGRLHPYRIPQEPGERFSPIVSALTLLRDLHRRRNHVPVSGTIGRLLDETRAHAGFVLRPSGEQALANVLQIAELARQYEATGGISFRGFVERLQEEAETGEASEAPILEEGSDGVRLMTVHKAKGLEFRVVILADSTAKITRASAGRYVDPARQLCAVRLAGWTPVDLLEHDAIEVERDRAEGVRLAYVAATRARDLLVVPAVGDEPYPEEGWLSPLYAAIYPPLDLRRHVEPAPACPKFGKDTVLERPDDGVFTEATVAPGLHRFPAGHAVVWWDPRALALEQAARLGLRREDLVGKDAPPDVVEADLAAYRAWSERRAAAIAHGAEPSLVVRTAREYVASLDLTSSGDQTPAPSSRDVQVIELPRRPVRPSGIRFGALVHAVLATVPLDGDRDRVKDVATLQGRVLGAPDEEVAAAAEVAARVLAHDVLTRARAAAARGAMHRETPVTMTQPDGTLVEGIVDLAFEETDAWTVVDFKTDQELAAELDAYRRQVRLYADMVAAATGRAARAVLMRI